LALLLSGIYAEINVKELLIRCWVGDNSRK
jgi:hypothetical protein